MSLKTHVFHNFVACMKYFFLAVLAITLMVVYDGGLLLNKVANVRQTFGLDRPAWISSPQYVKHVSQNITLRVPATLNAKSSQVVAKSRAGNTRAKIQHEVTWNPGADSVEPSVTDATSDFEREMKQNYDRFHIAASYYQKWKCSDSSAHKEIDSLCRYYRQGLVTGNMCSPLCDKDEIKFVGCMSPGWQKRILNVRCTNACEKGRTIEAILKTATTNITLDEFTKWREPANTSRDFIRAARDLAKKFTHAYSGFQVLNGKDPLEVLWGQGSDDDLDSLQYSSAVWRSLSLLMPQGDYLLAKAFGEKYRIFPKVWGTCGYYYLQEFCQVHRKDYAQPQLRNLGKTESSWIGRVKDTFATLELNRMEHSFPDQLISCDIKPGNMGFCSVYFNSTMQYLRTTPCLRDSEVGFGGGCLGKCHTEHGKCVLDHNINLEICGAVLMDPKKMTKYDHPQDGYGQYLRDPPPGVSAALDRALHDCESLPQLLLHETGARQRVLRELQTILNHSLVHPEY